MRKATPRRHDLALYLAALLASIGGSAQIATIDFDSDHDGILTLRDNCPRTFNPGQEDSDGDGVGDACDNCRNTPNPDQADCNQNGIGDICEPFVCGASITFPREGSLAECIQNGRVCLLVTPHFPQPCLPWLRWCCPAGADCLPPKFRLVRNGTNEVLRRTAADYGLSAQDGFGLAATLLPDLDGDGIPELAIGAPFASTPGAPGAGVVLFLNGADGRELRRVYGQSESEAFGISIVRYQGDGRVLVGASGAASNVVGRIVLVHPLDGEPETLLFGTDPGDGFGTHVTAFGDHFAVSAPGQFLGPQGFGKVHVVDRFGVVLQTLMGSEPADGFGIAVHAVGRGDGSVSEDLLIGSPFASPSGRFEAGTVRLFSGTRVIRQWNGEAAEDHLGMSVGGDSDIDGDGRPDFILGSPGVNTEAGPDAGRAYVYSARGGLLGEYDGYVPNGYFGQRVFLDSDENGDGVADAVVVASDENYPGGRGRTHTIETLRPRRPMLEIIRPSAGSKFIEPAVIEIEARLFDPDGVTHGAAFFIGTNLMAQFSAPPFRFTVTNPPPAGIIVATTSPAPGVTNSPIAGNVPHATDAIPIVIHPAGTPSIPGLFNTGVDDAGIPRSDDAAELHYRLVGNSAVVGIPVVATEVGGFPIPPWLSDGPDSAWIAPSASTIGLNARDGSANFFYETSFDLGGLDPAGAVIDGRWVTDNLGLDILLNGASTGNRNVGGFSDWTPFRVEGGFLPGRNTLTFVLNNGADEDTLEAPTGLRVEMRSAALPCSFVVTRTADTGPGSLRAAIDCANHHPGLDTITFAIPGAGPHTIQPLTPLPVITDPVVIDGLTQPGAVANSEPIGNNARLLIELEGSLVSNHALVVAAANSTLRGLVINRFTNGIGILLSSSSNVVEGCFVGTAVSGGVAQPNQDGIWIKNAAFNRIGGADPRFRNVLSGNRYAGLYIEGPASVRNQIQGNYFGVDASGMNSLGNGTTEGNGGGILIYQGAFNFIGGPNPREGNVISANRQGNVGITGHSNTVQGNFVGTDAVGTSSLGSGYYGVLVWRESVGNAIGGTNAGAGNLISGNPRGINIGFNTRFTWIAGNKIGTDVSGERPLGNSVDGIHLEGGSSDTLVGGTALDSANVIAFNGSHGVRISSGSATVSSSVKNSLWGNSIYGNGRLGIELAVLSLPDEGSEGPTLNDSSDADSGPNGLQNFPFLTSASLAGGNVVIAGTLNSKANGTYRIEFFANAVADPSGYGEGEVFLGFTNVVTDAAGGVRFTAVFRAVAALHCTATATDSAGNTSEFSPAIGLAGGSAVPCLWNTGVDSAGNPLPDDASERHYVLAQGSPVAGTPFVAQASAGFPIPPWLADNPSSAWITPTTNTQATGAAGGSAVYRYETSFDLTGFDPSSAVISGRWSTDNRGLDILINGVSTGEANAAQFGAWTPFHIRGGFQAGPNRLTFLVSNGEGELTPFGPTGLRVEMKGVGTSSGKLSIRRRGNQVVLSWQGPGFTLQEADGVTGPWSDVSAGTSLDGVNFEVTVQPNDRMKFFRLRLDRACVAACAQFVQTRVVYQRVSDGLEVGSEIIPATGFSRANIARERRIIVAVTAADNQNGVKSMSMDGEIRYDCVTPGGLGVRRNGLIHVTSDEVRNGTSAPGQPMVRTEHFTLDPFEHRPDRLLCSPTDYSSAVNLAVRIRVINGRDCVTDSGFLQFAYLPRPADCPVLPSPLSGDGTDNVNVSVVRDGVPDDQVGLELTVAPSITWWKAVNIAGSETWTQDNRRSSRITIALSQVVANPVLELKKAKFLGVHTGVQTLTLPTPAALGGCTISLQWTKDN